MILYAISDSPVGKLLLAQSRAGICSIILADNTTQLVTELKQRFPHSILQHEQSLLTKPLQNLLQFIEHPGTTFDFKLDLHGTAFQQQAWQAMQKIPVGSTISYQQLAKNIGRPNAVRAVANACAANKLAIIIPCHRVIGANGQMTGYRWGIERKQKLLAIERQVTLP